MRHARAGDAKIGVGVGSGRQRDTVEHHPHNATGGDLPEMQTIEQRLGRVFVAPRVVDQHAFEQFSSTLRDLMREAATHGRTLLSATNDIRSLDVHVKEAGKELQGSLEAASKTLPQIDQRLAKAEQVAAIISGFVSLGQGTTRCFGFEDLHQIIVAMKRGYLFVSAMGAPGCLGVVAVPGCDIGNVGYQMALLVERAGRVLTPELVDELKQLVLVR